MNLVTPKHAITPQHSRRTWLLLAIQIELLSLVWTLAEAVLSGVAGFRIGSLSLSAFSVDSAVELVSGNVLFVRLALEYLGARGDTTERLERLASALVGVCLFVLAGVIALKSGQAFALRRPMNLSGLGLVVAALSSLVSPWLARMKFRLGEKLHSHALLGDAACTMTCAYMAWTLLLGLLAQWWLGWWWIDPVVALGILYFVLREAWESVTAAWTGEAHVHSH